MIKISALAWVPEFAQGYVRDIRIRWALEEANVPYEVVLIEKAQQLSMEYLKWQPFKQVPAYEDKNVRMFESGAILLYLARKYEVLAPNDESGQATVMCWLIAAQNTIEPFVQNWIDCEDSPSDEKWAQNHKQQIEIRLNNRLSALSDWLGNDDYLTDRFTVADLMMVSVLRELADSGILLKYPNLETYRKRGEERHAFIRAYEAQMESFRNYKKNERKET